MASKHDKVKSTPQEQAHELDRRAALLKIVMTTAYVVPTAAVLLAMSKDDAEAGQVLMSNP